MKKKTYLSIFFALAGCAAAFSAPKKEKPLMTIDQAVIYPAEFIEFYSHNLPPKDSVINIEKIFEDFTDFRLMLKEAQDMRLDTFPQAKKLYDTYRADLLASALVDTNQVNVLAREAFERSKYDLRASHIFIPVSRYATAADTSAYLKILRRIREKLIGGEPFEGEELGWFTVFQMPYSFETTTYNTPVGQISELVRTKVGYHLVKVTEKRPAYGEVELSQIVVSKASDPEGKAIAQIRSMVEEGADFRTLATQYSEDDNTRERGGYVGRIYILQMSDLFQNALASLKNKGELTPVIEDNDYRIFFRLENRFSTDDFEAEKSGLIARMGIGNERSRLIYKPLLDRLKTEYPTDKVAADILSKISDILQSGEFERGKLRTDEFEEISDSTLLTIGDKKYAVNDFLSFLMSNADDFGESIDFPMLMDDLLARYKDLKLLDFYTGMLEKNDPVIVKKLDDFSKNNLLYFLRYKKIIEPAQNNTDELRKTYDLNPGKFMFPQVILYEEAVSYNRATAEAATKLYGEGYSGQNIADRLNKGLTVNIYITEKKGTAEDFPKEMPVKAGISDIYPQQENKFKFYNITRFYDPEKMSFEDALPALRKEYAQKLEAGLPAVLREAHKVIVDPSVMKKTAKQLKALQK